MIASTETSMSSPIMMLWLDLRVSTSMGIVPPYSPGRQTKQPDCLVSTSLRAAAANIAVELRCAQAIPASRPRNRVATLGLIGGAWRRRLGPAVGVLHDQTSFHLNH